jgi:undecaprenyl-diphosphatase
MQTSGSRRFFSVWTAVAAIALLCIVLSVLGYGQAVVLGLVQGLGEFLPISSSAHLIITPWIFGWNEGVADTLTFDVALHVGTLLALIGFFWRDWIDLLMSAHKPSSSNGRLFWMIVIASVPAGIIGLLLDELAGNTFRSPWVIVFTLSIMGVLLWWIDKQQPQEGDLSAVGPREATMIGFAQALALIPGVSRSGATMTMGRWLKLDRQTAARFSFLMSMPITAGVGLLKARDIMDVPSEEFSAMLVGMLVAALTGAVCIKFLLDYLRRASFAVFAIYRIFLAVVILILLLVRG